MKVRWLSVVLTLSASTLASVLVSALAQDSGMLRSRYNIEFNPIIYPQKTPQEALKSAVKAFDSDRYDYLLAHLADPKFVDARVAEYVTLIYGKDLLQKEEIEIARESDPKKMKRLRVEKDLRDRARFVVAFNRMVIETKKHHVEDPVLRKELRLMVREGEWDVEDDKATVTLKKVTTRKAIFRKRDDRWFQEERVQ